MKKIRKKDLARLASIAREDREDLFERKSRWSSLYRNNVLCVTLAQGAALHYINGTNGVKDFDVWTFYHRQPGLRFPFDRRNASRDFMDTRFGFSPESPSHYSGTRIDLLCRDMECSVDESYIDAIHRYLRLGRTTSARYLAKKAMVVLEPEKDMGKVIWPLVEMS